MTSTLYISSRDSPHRSTTSFIVGNVGNIIGAGKYAVDVASVSFPKVMPNVSLINARPWISVNGAAATQVSVANGLTPGVNYTGTTLATALATMLNAHVGGTIAVTYSSETFKLTLANGTNTIRFSSSAEGLMPGRKNGTQRFLETCGWGVYDEVTLAASTTYPTVSSNVVSNDCNVVKLNGTDYVDLCCRYNTFSNHTGIGQPQVLQRIYTPDFIGTITTYVEGYPMITADWCGTMIQNAVFFFRDEWGELYEIPLNYTISITLNLQLVPNPRG